MFTDYNNNIVPILAENSAILSIILSLFDLIFIAMSFSIAIRINDSKLFWVSEDLCLVFSSLSLEKYLSYVHSMTLSVTMNVAYKFSYAAAHSLHSDNNLKVYDKQFLHVVLADDSATSVYSPSDSKLSESFSLSFIFSSSPFFRSL